MTEPPGYVLESTLREGGEFTVYRGRRRADSCPVLVVALSADQPSPQRLRRLEHEFSLEADLDPAWAIRPLALTHHDGRRILVLEDPGGVPLDRILEYRDVQPHTLETKVRLSPLLGVLKNDTTPMMIDNPPFLDLLQGSKAAEAGKVIVQAATSYARRLSGAVDIIHGSKTQCESLHWTTRAKGNPGNASQGTGRLPAYS